MPARDEQDFEKKRQRIIDGALSVFSRKGFEKATNREIARASRIGSPGLIYHYFKDKADLFNQVLRERTPAIQLLDRGHEMMDLPAREALALFGGTLLRSLSDRKAVGMFKLVIGEATRRPFVAELMSRAGPMKALTFLSAYLEKQMDAGLMKRMHPGIAARLFVGPLVAHVLTRELFKSPDSAEIDAEEMVSACVEVFLRGMEYTGP
jgi:AcrR family transcriptional regulator